MLTSKTVSAVFKRYIKLREEKKSWFFPPFLNLGFRAILHNGDNDQNINRKTNLIWNSYQLWQIPLSWQSMTNFLKKNLCRCPWHLSLRLHFVMAQVGILLLPFWNKSFNLLLVSCEIPFVIFEKIWDTFSIHKIIHGKKQIFLVKDRAIRSNRKNTLFVALSWFMSENIYALR